MNRAMRSSMAPMASPSIAASPPRSRTRLNPDGAVMVEIGAGQAAGVEALFRRAGFSNIDAIRDLARIERVIRARLS